MSDLVTKMVDALNEALAADPDAMRHLLKHRVSCNEKLADHTQMVVEENLVVSGFNFGALGLLNGALAAAGLPKIASKWEKCPSGSPTDALIGFQIYEEPKR